MRNEREYRTQIQIDANDLDLVLFNAAGACDVFAEKYGEKMVAELGDFIGARRGRVRKYISEKDQEATI